MAAVTASVIATGLAAKSSIDQSKAAKAARKAAESSGFGGGAPGTIDIEALNEVVRRQSRQNITDSLALEQEISPETAQLRSQSIRNLLARANGQTEVSAEEQQLQQVLNELRGIGEIPNSELFQGAVTAAQDDLALGGELPQDVRNAVFNRGLAQAARVGGGRLDLGRAIVPRDLGLTSLQLRNDRIGRAADIGGAENALNLQRDAATQSRLGLGGQLIQLLSSLGGAQQQRDINLAQFGQQLAPPVVGLSPGSVADIIAQNQAGGTEAATNIAKLRGQERQSRDQALATVLGSLANSNLFNNTGGTGTGRTLGTSSTSNSPFFQNRLAT